MINLEMPDDVYAYVREYQGKMKAKKNTQIALQKCICEIIREHKRLMEKYSLSEISPSAPEVDPTED